MTRTKPAVTVLICCYNQEHYIGEALESVLAQTYRPLEILVSDDCSTDATYDVVERIARDYKGPHAVRLNRNSRNMSPGHFRVIWPKVTGDICVIADGDDVQHRDRVKASVAALLEHDVSLVTCNATLIDPQGREQGAREDPRKHADVSLKTFLKTGINDAAFGAGLAFRREIMDDFGPILETPRNSDGTLVFRALLQKGCHVIADPRYVKWRIHDANRTLGIRYNRSTDEAERMRILEQISYNRVANLHANLHDLSRHIKRNPEDPRGANLRAAHGQLANLLFEVSRGWCSHRLRMAKEKVLAD